MKGSPDNVKGFGYELHGQEEAGRMLAEYVDEAFQLEQLGLIQVKEKFKQPVCVHGVGCGKSALLSHGLSLHRTHCRNNDLLELLGDHNHPLAIHISFNSKTSFRHEYETRIDLALIRRILASCLGLNWEDALVLPLGESLRVQDCLRALMTYHKAVNGMKADQKLFVYLGIDEINQLVYYSGLGAKPDITSLKGVVKALKSLSPPNGFVSTLLAGTHFADMTESFFGTGIKPLNLRISRLSEEAIDSMLRTDAGVSLDYIDNPKFQELRRDIGPLMRAIGIAISQLDYDCREQSIDRAKTVVKDYLKSNRMQLSVNDMHALYGLVLTGRPVSPLAPLSEGSLITLDSLQNSGTIVLEATPDAELCQVFMSRLMLDSYFHRESGHTVVDSAKRLLGFIDTHGPDSFEKFVAHFYGMKKAVLQQSSPGGAVPFASFYSGALIGGGLLYQELRLKPVPLEYPDGVMWRQGERFPETAEPQHVSDHLKNGGVVLNSKGAAADLLAGENLRDWNSSEWQEGMTVYAMKHTIVGNTELTLKDITADLDKAVKVLRSSKNHSNALVTMVHFSNRELSKELRDVTTWRPEWRRSVIVDRSNIESVLGPMFGRMLTSKGFYDIGGGAKARAYSTLARAVATGRRYQGTIWMNRMFR